MTAKQAVPSNEVKKVQETSQKVPDSNGTDVKVVTKPVVDSEKSQKLPLTPKTKKKTKDTKDVAKNINSTSKAPNNGTSAADKSVTSPRNVASPAVPSRVDSSPKPKHNTYKLKPRNEPEVKAHIKGPKKYGIGITLEKEAEDRDHKTLPNAKIIPFGYQSVPPSPAKSLRDANGNVATNTVKPVAETKTTRQTSKAGANFPKQRPQTSKQVSLNH